jgi:NADPH-dependent glutamate synthase beta subunit-like oxidoreductase/dihydroorotate dehydrogenase/Pyruvate/2-oxoacid:ferredoxin oxidoreductase delta subunit
MKNNKQPPLMTWSRLQTELLRCEYCEDRPCQEACPVNCSPFDFIMAARRGNRSDIKRAAAEIIHNNPLGGVCGMVCPDTLCMAACSRKDFDGAIDIPLVQSTIVHMAKELGGIPKFTAPSPNGMKVAVIGGGPAGLAAAAAMAQMGYLVDLFEARDHLGGMMNLIPDHRLNKSTMKTDIEFLLSMGTINVTTETEVEQPADLLKNGYKAVCVSTGLWKPIELGVENEDLAIKMVNLLSNPTEWTFNGRVAVVGGGATAIDCAITAKERGAKHVEMYMLEKLKEMPLTARERQELLDFDIEVNGRIRLRRILEKSRKVSGIETIKVTLPENKPFSPANVQDVPGTEGTRNDIDAVIVAIGMRPTLKPDSTPGVFYCGDMLTGPKTVVEAVASGKNVAHEIDAHLKGLKKPVVLRESKSYHALPGYNRVPVNLETDFFGRIIRSPYLLSASPVTDGLDQMNLAYQAGWAGGIMKTAFDNLPIHIPSEYMFTFDPTTYGNSDNVSGHSLDRVCKEIEQLVKDWPDRLTIGSTGGPVTGNDESDSATWQSNTRKLEQAGAMGIEYSLSCPQGGDGTEGDIVSQNAELTAKIIDWIMDAGKPEIPKLFKLSAAVTSIVPILRAIRGVLDKYPDKKAGITLANSFPTLAFRPGTNGNHWDEGVIVGMSGEGVTPISYLTLARAVPEGIEISGNGGPMHYKAAMDFLALGVKTVQFCTIAMKYGIGIIQELESGTSFYMQEKGLKSLQELIGIAQPHPITDFMALTPIKKLSEINQDLCVLCGNCTRCPYLAIEFDETGQLWTNPAKCIGCSICAKKCFVGAITLRERTESELEMLVEH